MTGFFNGVATAMITPFQGGKVNLAAFGDMMEYQIEGGADALVVLGTTGEPAVISAEEKEKLISYAVKNAAGRVKIIVGVGSNCTQTALDNAVKAQALGADGLLAVTPYYNKCTQKGIVAYYKAICEAVTLPVIAYNVPSRTGVNILPETAEKLAEIPNLAGIKEASGNMAQVLETARRIRGKCDLYSGEDALNLPIFCVGGAGTVSVLSNLAPSMVKWLYRLAKAGMLTEAVTLHDRLLPIADACFIEVNPIPVKEGLNLLGFDAGEPVPPLTVLEPEHRARLIAAMKTIGLEIKE